jgi:hypothetical protein
VGNNPIGYSDPTGHMRIEGGTGGSAYTPKPHPKPKPEDNGGGGGNSCTTLACLTGSSSNVFIAGGGGGCATLACLGYIKSLSGEYLTGNPAPDPALSGVTLNLDTSPDGFISQAGNAVIPNYGVTSPTLTPEFSQNLINSINSFQYYPVIGQYLSYNGIGIGDYLYNPVLPHLAVKTVVNGWMKFTKNNPVMAGPIIVMPTILVTGNQNLGIAPLFQKPQYY